MPDRTPEQHAVIDRLMAKVDELHTEGRQVLDDPHSTEADYEGALAKVVDALGLEVRFLREEGLIR